MPQKNKNSKTLCRAFNPRFMGIICPFSFSLFLLFLLNCTVQNPAFAPLTITEPSPVPVILKQDILSVTYGTDRSEFILSWPSVPGIEAYLIYICLHGYEFNIGPYEGEDIYLAVDCTTTWSLQDRFWQQLGRVSGQTSYTHSLSEISEITFSSSRIKEGWEKGYIDPGVEIYYMVSTTISDDNVPLTSIPFGSRTAPAGPVRAGFISESAVEQGPGATPLTWETTYNISLEPMTSIIAPVDFSGIPNSQSAYIWVAGISSTDITGISLYDTYSDAQTADTNQTAGCPGTVSGNCYDFVVPDSSRIELIFTLVDNSVPHFLRLWNADPNQFSLIHFGISSQMPDELIFNSTIIYQN